MFEAGRELDRATLFADDAVWWNGLPHLPGLEGKTEHRGIDAIRRILRGSGQPHPGTGVDSYDLATNRFHRRGRARRRRLGRPPAHPALHDARWSAVPQRLLLRVPLRRRRQDRVPDGALEHVVRTTRAVRQPPGGTRTPGSRVTIPD